ncbi:MAG: sigma-70 family RNA polymerase sigma factor [Schlesneria sp.]
MSSENQGDITKLVANLKAGSQDALGELLKAYSPQLKAFARKYLSGRVKLVSDEDDVIVSVFFQLWDKVQNEGIPEIDTRVELWPLLLTIAKQKAIDHSRRAARKKRGGKETIESLEWDPAKREPTPDMIASRKEEIERLMKCLDDDTQRQIARLKLAVYENKEIADVIGRTERTVERRLKTIRDKWKKEIEKWNQEIELI